MKSRSGAARRRSRGTKARSRPASRKSASKSRKPMKSSRVARRRSRVSRSRPIRANNSMNMTELQVLAKSRGIPFGGLNKTQLIRKINNFY